MTVKMAPRGHCDDCGHPRAAHLPLRWNANLDRWTRETAPDWRAPGCIAAGCGCAATWTDRGVGGKSSREVVTELPDIPAPEVACRQARPDEIPRSAVALHKAARENGWEARVTYARGTSLNTRGKPAERTERIRDDDETSQRQFTVVKLGAKVVDSIAVRFRRPDSIGYAIWIDGAFDVAWVRDAAGPHRLGAREVLAYVRQPTPGEVTPCSDAA